MTDRQPGSAAHLLEGWSHDLRVAATFFTRVAVPHGGPFALSDLSRAWRAVPLVGAAIGAIGGAVFVAARHFGLAELAAALLALAATALLTGALHEDGLADFADGMGGGDPARRLAIMRDSRTGVFGALALVFSVGLRGAALAAIVPPGRAFLAMVAAHALSRAVIPAVMTAIPPARTDGLGAGAGAPDRPALVQAVILAGLIALGLLGPAPGLAALAAACMAAIAVAGMARSRIGGYTGDVLGAVQQAAETAALLALSAIMSGAR